MAITDLTNTTWYIPSGWSSSSAFGRFSINGTVNQNGYETEYFSFHIGSSFDGDYNNTANSVLFDGYGITVYNSTQDFCFSIIGGTDVTNTSLIQWLETYGTQLKVTDLTNTSWNVPAGWVAEAGYGRFDIGVIVNDMDFSGLSNREFDVGYNFVDEVAVERANYITFGDYSYFSFFNSTPLVIQFVNGNDTSNPKLIAWLSKYGELQGGEVEEPEEPEEPTTPKKKFTKLIPETLAEGTAIIPGNPPKYIYFNTNNRLYKTTEALSQLTYVQTDLFEFPISLICGFAFKDSPNNPVAIVSVKIPQENIVSPNVLPHNGYYYQIICVYLGYSMVTIFDSTDKEWVSANNGFIADDYDPMVLCPGKMLYCSDAMFEDIFTITDFNGLPVGAENEKIKNVLSTTPFVVNINSSGANTSGIIGTSWQELVDGGYIIIGANGLSTLYDGDEDNLSKIKIAGELVIPYIDGVTAIDDNGFKWMETLTKVTIPDGISMLSDSAFAYCNNLQNVTLPKTLITIGGECFNSCTRLENIVIPNEVGEIMDDAFVGCWRLTNITFEGTMEQWNNIRFGERWNEYVPATYVQCTDGQVYLTE